MDKISEQLIQLSDKLDQAGKTKCANIIDELLEHKSLTKVAQYVGVIGYVLKQNRAMGNCIRKKRASSKEPMQEIVLGCLREYQDGQQYDNNEWTSKYAQVVEQLPDQFASSHINFLEALAEENHINQHVDRVKLAQSILAKDDSQDILLNQIVSDLKSLEEVLKEGDADHRPFKLAAPESPRGQWSRLWSPSWSRRGKDKDTQFEMDAVLESLMNIQGDIQQIRGGISQMRYQSRTIQNPTIQQHLQNLSDTNWERTYKGIYRLHQELLSLLQQDPVNGANLIQTSSQVQNNIDQVFDEIKNVQSNMYNLRLRDPIKGRGSLKSATEEYSDLAQTLDRLYINPLDERALHYALKLHGRLEDTLNERASALDPSYNQWVNAPESELGESRFNEDFDIAPKKTSPEPVRPTTMDSSIASSIAKITDDPETASLLIDCLGNMESMPNSPEIKDGIRELIGVLTEKQQIISRQQQPITSSWSQPNVVQTGSGQSTSPSMKEILSDMVNKNGNAGLVRQHLGNWKLLHKKTASSLKKLTKVADVLSDWNSDLAELLKEYIENEEYHLPEFPSVSSLIKEYQGSGEKIT